MADVQLDIGADNSGLLAALAEAKAAVAATAADMKASLKTVTDGFQKYAMGVTAILAGGGAFKDIIESTVTWSEGANKLSKALGISTEKASAYQIAAKRLGIDNDVLIDAAGKLSKQIYTNAGAFEKLGVSTKDAQGHFRPVADVMGDVNTALLAIPNTLERNIAGQQVYGKGWDAVRATLKITSDALEEAGQRGKELGLIVGPDGAAQAHAYKESINDVKLVGTALANQLGQQLIPILTQVGIAFSDDGPEAANVFGEAIKQLAYVVGTVAIEFEKMGKWLGGLAASAGALLSGDLDAYHAIAADFDQDLERLNKKADTLWDTLNRPVPKRMGKDADTDGPMPFDSKEKDASRAGEWETELAEKKAAYQADAAEHGQLLEFSKQQEIEYWQSILATTKTTLEERKQIRAKIAADELGIDKEQLEGALAALKNKADADKTNLSARLADEMQFAAAVKGVYGAESKQYADAQKAIVETKRAAVEQERALDNIRTQAARNAELAQIALAEDDAREQYDLHAITLAQYIAEEQAFENRKFALRQAELQKEQSLLDPNNDPVKFAQLKAQIEALEQQHVAAMAKIDQQGTKVSLEYYKTFYNSMESGFNNAISGMLKGTQTLSQGIRSIFKSILDSIVQTLASIAAKWLANSIMEQIMSKTSGATQVAANASAAATAAMASVAAIPVTGWAMAPGVGAATFAQAMSFMPSAEGGWDIPRGINPMLQAHSGEMVLPEKQADVIRNMADSGAGGGSSTTHLNIKALDGKSVQKVLTRNAGHVQKAVKKMNARFMK
jgi:hypothetical protein